MKSNILNKEFDVKTVHIGLMVSDDLWVYDKWAVIINGQTFDYHTGIGHREAANKWGETKREFERLQRINPKQTKENILNYAEKLKTVSKPKALKLDDVLYSLIIDANVLDMDFEDFCGEFGYDEDSRKAERIYNDCRKNAKKVKTFIDDLEGAREKFQDY